MACASSGDLYINNDVTISLAGLYDTTDVDSTPIIDATVTAEVYASTDLASIIGTTISMPYVAATDEYLGVIDAAMPLVENTQYTIIITASATGGRDGEWRLEKVANYQIVDN